MKKKQLRERERTLIGTKGTVVMQPSDGRATYVQVAQKRIINGKERVLLKTIKVGNG